MFRSSKQSELRDAAQTQLVKKVKERYRAVVACQNAEQAEHLGAEAVRLRPMLIFQKHHANTLLEKLETILKS